MTTTVRVAATTSADTSYTFTIPDKSSAQFGCSGLVENEEILIQKKTSSGYDDLYYEDEEGNPKKAVMKSTKNSIRINGPFDGRINKPETSASVEVVQYS